jgi:hypothetical protein
MKKLFPFTMIAVCLLLFTSAIQAQTPQKNLNQVELMKQQIGTWKCDDNKDTTVFWVGKSYGTGLDCYSTNVVRGKTVREGRELWGYDQSIDKFICASLDKGKDIELKAVWFTSKNVYEYIRYSDISNPEKASWKIVGELTSPDVVVETTTENNKITLVETYKLIKH